MANLVRECCLQYPVSSYSIERFIKKYYVEPGIVKLSDGIIYPVTTG